MTEDVIKRVREDGMAGPRQGATKSGDDWDRSWQLWWDRIEENARYQESERAVKDERNAIERKSIARRKGTD